MINDYVRVWSQPLKRCCLISLWLSYVVFSSMVFAQAVAPVLGQAGKDVVWIPSPNDMVEKMLDMAKVTPEDFVIDLGSGDGRNVIAAATRGARALGVEYNADLVEVSQRAALAAGVADRASFVQGDMYEADISRATVLILFLIPDNLRKLAAKFRTLAPGTRLVSNTYEIAGWYPEQTDRTTPCLTWCVASLYLVPPEIAGVWKLDDAELNLEQDMQLVFGDYSTGGWSVRMEGGRLHGNEVRFTVNGIAYEGRVNGNTMEGVAKGRITHAWKATRAP